MQDLHEGVNAKAGALTPGKDLGLSPEPLDRDQEEKPGSYRQSKLYQHQLKEKERRRRRALYGTRASTKIFDSPAITSRPSDYGKQNKAEPDK